MVKTCWICRRTEIELAEIYGTKGPIWHPITDQVGIRGWLTSYGLSDESCLCYICGGLIDSVANNMIRLLVDAGELRVEVFPTDKIEGTIVFGDKDE